MDRLQFPAHALAEDFQALVHVGHRLDSGLTLDEVTDHGRGIRRGYKPVHLCDIVDGDTENLSVGQIHAQRRGPAQNWSSNFTQLLLNIACHCVRESVCSVVILEQTYRFAAVVTGCVYPSVDGWFNDLVTIAAHARSHMHRGRLFR